MKGLGAFVSLTFDLQAKVVAVTLVSVFHMDGIGPTVLLFDPDQGQNALVPTQINAAVTKSAAFTQ